MNDEGLILAYTESYMENLDQLSNKKDMVSNNVFLRAYIKTLGRYCSQIKKDEVFSFIYDSSLEKRYSISDLKKPQSTENVTIIYVVSLLDCCRLIPNSCEKEGKVCKSIGTLMKC